MKLDKKNVMLAFSSMVLLLAAVGPQLVAAEFKYKDSSSPNGMPDFPQCNEGICAAVAAANCMWYFDKGDPQNPKEDDRYPCLVDNTDESDHSEDWLENSEELINDLDRLIYGKRLWWTLWIFKSKSYGTAGGIEKYLKERGHLACQVEDGLSVKSYWNTETKTNANYSFWESELKRSQNVIGSFRWHNPDCTWLKNGGSKVSHAMTGAGWDTEKKKLIVSNPWGGHDRNESDPPVSEDYYNKYPIMDPTTTGGKVRITDPGLVNGVTGSANCNYVEMVGMYTVCPGKDTDVTDSVSPGKEGYIRYSYVVNNYDFVSIYKFALEVQTPYDPSSVTSPSGWHWQPWDPTQTPGLSPPPEHAEEHVWEPDWTGIYWYTETNPIAPSAFMEGFSFESPDIYPPGEFVSLRALGDIDGHVAELGETSGPTEIPVGGIVVPVDKFGLLAPHIGLASTILVVTVTIAIYAKRVKRIKAKG